MAHIVKKIGIIGVGGISDWHLRAFRKIGCDVTSVASRPGSARVEPFAKKHTIPHIYSSWQELLDKADIDGVLVATHVDGTAAVLSEVLNRQLPALVEKPVSFHPDLIDPLILKKGQIMVAYNRRFYRTVQACKSFVQSGEPLVAQMNLPEGINWDDKNRSYLYPFFENSCHGIDMLNFIFDGVDVRSSSQIKNNKQEVIGFSAVLCSQRGDLIQLTGNWGAPGNFSLTLDRPGRRFELKPFEMVTVYEGMEMIDPTPEFPIRRYLPKMKERILLEDIDLQEKPGFTQQASAFVDFMNGKKSPVAATLEEARKDVSLCEQLIGVRYPSLESLASH
ncbi:MAG: Inositol 2-dehydrogenase/D-chiro-inositol 3-dehydrogenase [Elusimicrobia bacterium]|nr:Inositol 2-dehydrogenase/D-chiro-inositol 3-dehydrogenase [Elusimicrobiota bacterium]